MNINVVEVNEKKGAICADVLRALPLWFGIPESNEAYAREVESMRMFAVFEGTSLVIGFLALHRHTEHAFEIHVMGVRPEGHRKGIGRALIETAEGCAREAGARFLTVKTLSPARPDANYAKTREFYEGVGFVPIEEFPTLWHPANPALMLIKVLG